MRKMTFKVATFAAGVLAATSGAQADVLEVPLATWGSPTHINVTSFVGTLEDDLAESSNGEITLKHFPSGQLAEDTDMPIAIPSGKVKFGWVALNGWTGILPDVKFADVPFGLTMEQLGSTADGPDGIKAILNEQLSSKRMEILAITPQGPTIMVTNFKATVPSDFEGKKIRVYSEGLAELVRALGGAPVSLPFADVYTALQRGTIDGAVTGYNGVDSQKMYEVVKYLLVPSSFTGAGGYMGWVVNTPWWNEIDAEKQATIRASVGVAETASRKAMLDDRARLAAYYESKGMEVYELAAGTPEYSAWLEATQGIVDGAQAALSAEILSTIKAAVGE